MMQFLLETLHSQFTQKILIVTDDIYTDVWSAGCVLAELLLGQPIFPGDSGVDQLVEIIKVLGTPTREQIREMNPNYSEFKFPQIKAHPWTKVSSIVPPASNFWKQAIVHAQWAHGSVFL